MLYSAEKYLLQFVLFFLCATSTFAHKNEATDALMLSERVLIVYNANAADSIDVANYYRAKRNIPVAQMCAITPSDNASIDWNEFVRSVKNPIKDCLNAVGKEKILYIVFAYQTPYRINQIPTESGYEYRSLDQFVADIWSDDVPDGFTLTNHPYFAAAQSQGRYFPPFVALAEYRNQPDAKNIYSVWRLDAANADLAKGLVDKAMQAETSGLQGQAYFDRRFGAIDWLDDWIYGAGDWDLFRAAAMTRQVGLPVTEDDQDAEFGMWPAPLQCDQVALYSGWYTFNHYNDVFTWATGAIGFHLDSGSALDPRGGENWAANAVQRGITVTSGAVNEPSLEGLPHTDGVFRNLFAGANVGDAFLRNTAFLQWMIINIGDPLYRPFPSGIAPFNAPNYQQNSLSFDSPFVVGGKSVTGKISLAEPAPENGLMVPLTNNRSWAVTIPESVFVPAGESSATFTATTEATTYYLAANIAATLNGETISNTLGMGPLLGAINVVPYYVAAGSAAKGTIYLNDFAPSGGGTITLTSDNPAVVNLPENIFIAEGQSKINFALTASAVSENSIVTITAMLNGATQTAYVVVFPSPEFSSTLPPRFAPFLPPFAQKSERHHILRSIVR